MTNHLELFIGTMILSFGIYYVSYKIFNMKIKAFSFFNIGVVLLYSTILTIFCTIAPKNTFRICCSVLLIAIMNQIIFKQGILKTLISSFIVFAVTSVAEIMWVILLAVLSKLNMQEMMDRYSLQLVTNIGITFFMVIIIHIKVFLNKFRELVGTIYLRKKLGTIIWSLCSITCLSLLFYYIYFQVTPINALLICLFLIGCYTCLPLILFKEYNTTIKNLNDYERMLDIQRMKNHENDNNLSAIRGMIDPQNKEAINFIDSLRNKDKQNSKDISLKTKDIPSGGLQGIISQKILLMEQKKYHYNLEVSKEVKKLKLKELDVNDIKDMCTITGVFIDNAIQAVQKYKKRLVGIYLYKEDNYLVITISNNFKGNLDIQKFEERGYTTKEQGHGYGLSLVKEILNKNHNIINIKCFNGEIFSQILKIKIR